MEEFSRDIIVSKKLSENFSSQKLKDTLFLQKIKDFRAEISQTHNQFIKEINELELNINKFEEKNPYKFNIKENLQNPEVYLIFNLLLSLISKH